MQFYFEVIMNLSTKGRYAVMAVADLCLQKENNIKETPVSLNSISARQNISVRYLEQLFLKLRRAGIVLSSRGANGGYILAKNASEINVEEVIKVAGEEIKITRCGNLDSKGQGCLKEGLFCVTHDIWVNISKNISSYLESVTIQDICNEYIEKSKLKREEINIQNG